MASVGIREQLGLDPLAELTKQLNILFYGPPNAGKTYLSATSQDVPELSPVFHMGFEKGLLTVAYRDKYEAKEIRTIDALEKATKLLQQDQASDKPYYKMLIVDNATELQNLDIDTVMRQTKKTAKNPDLVDIDIPSPREWGKIGKRLRRCVVGLRDLPMHTIWTAWEGEKKNDLDEDVMDYYPKLAGHMKLEFSGYFDIVGRVQMKSKTIEGVKVPFQTLQVQETARVKAKWRNKPPEVPGIIEQPSMQMIWDFVQKTPIGKPV